jgi:vacuolar protein sorting-associated protein 13A/C
MAKQFVIAALEEVIGEYVLNLSKENLTIAALSGKIKLENVQLDGDLLGSHVLGAIGLGAGFGVLSCSARQVIVSVPWGNLENEPTKMEVRGVHLVCIPLMPATAHCLFGAGTIVDPRCALRTRAKRLRT